MNTATTTMTAAAAPTSTPRGTGPANPVAALLRLVDALAVACRLSREARLLQFSDAALAERGLTRDEVREQLIASIPRG
ncbi:MULTISPECIES: hypothetical protein [unclassified Rhodosalinus]|uniref:hypothetical protein n=1 Tax=unclassified Rhodosalinus TaxID=2630183 RepID=UPI003524526D